MKCVVLSHSVLIKRVNRDVQWIQRLQKVAKIDGGNIVGEHDGILAGRTFDIFVG